MSTADSTSGEHLTNGEHLISGEDLTSGEHLTSSVDPTGIADPTSLADDGTELVSAFVIEEERDAEATLRPRRLAEFIAQHRVREQLDLLLQSAMRRGEPPEHILLSGSPGLGKTTLAMIVAAELGAGLRITSGPAIERSGDLAAVLTSLARGDVLFIDEIHRIARPAEELLYSAMEDFRVDVIVGKGPGATAIPLDVEPFTLVGATTRSGLLTGPMRDRFGFVGHLDFYEPAELDVLLHRSARILGVPLTEDGATEIAGRSRGTPRIANRLLRRVRDYAEVRADGIVNAGTAQAALRVYDVDDLGLDRLDKAVLTALVRSFGGGPVGLSTLAVAVGEQPDTVEEVCEPFLVRAGLLARTPRGRVATAGAWRHLGLTPPDRVGYTERLGRSDTMGNGSTPDLFSQEP
ncbi:MAG: holliday junction helicase RuvB [Micromonosporaceae bacterium]|jgi:Holliday junction DNA helicase RuvB|nr:holliday junction helicase RuvB [Micromonosporaceae bacterium]